MEVVRKLVDSERCRKIGNHRVAVHSGVRHYKYYSTIIAIEYPDDRLFFIDDSYGTQSTLRACSAYRKKFLARGYTEIDTHK